MAELNLWPEICPQWGGAPLPQASCPASGAGTRDLIPVFAPLHAHLLVGSLKKLVLERHHKMSSIQFGRDAIRQIFQGASVRSSDGAVHPLFRNLEVMLTMNMEKLKKAGETVKVAPGYFQNHLEPKLLAILNIEKFAYLISEQRKIHQPQEVEEVQVVTETAENKMKEYEAAAKRLDNARLVLRRFINVEKLRTRATKDAPIELRSAVMKEELVSEDKYPISGRSFNTYV